MRGKRGRLFLLLTIPLALQGAARGQSAAAYPPVGKGARIFVTKSHPAYGELTREDFRRLADAGFTVAVNLWSFDIAGFAQRAGEAGLSTMNWNLGLVDKTSEADQSITRQGKVTKYTTTHSARAWQEVTDAMVKLAQISLRHPGFQGVGLDYEIYDPANVDGFSESYDDETFPIFLAAHGHAVPNPLPAPAERYEWLQKKSLVQLYIGYQVDKVAERAKAMRQAIDAVNPRFQIGIYGWGVLVPPLIHNLATAQAPALILDATAYGRTLYPYSATEPDRKGLRWTNTALSQIRDQAHKRYNNVVVLGGHYPQAEGPADGSQFKFTVKQAFDSAAFGEGYWIWTDWWTPEPWKDRAEWHNAMTDYFRLANNALDAGDYMWSAREPETIATKDAAPPVVLITSNGKARIAWNPRTGVRHSGKPPAPQPAGAAVAQHPKYVFLIRGAAVEARAKQTAPAVAPAAAASAAAPNTATATAGAPAAGAPAAAPEGEPLKRFAAGHGLSAFVLGNADGLPGDELITLNAGWVKVWDIETQAQLARFYVGADQAGLECRPS